jgi:RsiW-degrading membrane proteinase PrsW (M82 family)
MMLTDVIRWLGWGAACVALGVLAAAGAGDAWVLTLGAATAWPDALKMLTSSIMIVAALYGLICFVWFTVPAAGIAWWALHRYIGDLTNRIPFWILASTFAIGAYFAGWPLGVLAEFIGLRWPDV